MSESPISTQTPHATDPDLPLVRAAKSGSYEAFEQLVDRYEGSLYTLAMRIVRNAADAEEVVQESFLSVVEHLQSFAEQSSFKTWLIRVATNHALKVLRRRRNHPATSLDASGPDNEPPLPHPDYIAPWYEQPLKFVENRELQRLLDEAINGLDEKYRLVFLLRDVEGLSTQETAQALGISESNAKVRLLRARLMLREKLTRILGDPDKRVIPDHKHED